MRNLRAVNDRLARPSAEALLRELGGTPRLSVYLASAPGAGKTRRLLEDAIRLQESGLRVVIGWIETKGRPELDALAARVPRIPSRKATVGTATFEDFDFEAAVASKPQHLILDELAHTNLDGGAHAKRWQDALALREAGISVSGALNILHIETVAATAEGLIGHPIREIVPLSFLREADEVVALDASPEQFESRLLSGAVVRPEDIERARKTIYRPQTLRFLREMMLRTVNDLSAPGVGAHKTSRALALVTGEGDSRAFLRKISIVADALDLGLDVALLGNGQSAEAVGEVVGELDAHVVTLRDFDLAKPQLSSLKATLVAVPRGTLATRIAARPTERDVFILEPAPMLATERAQIAFPRYAQTSADRQRIGYGRLTIYLGAAAGSGKTYAMLDRGHQLKDAGVDVVGAFIETHKRKETVKKMEGLELLPRLELVNEGLHYSELDVNAVLTRHPAVALIDELAHTNAPGAFHAKRFDDVLQVLRAGISVMTSLNIQHLEGLNDAVLRLTGQRVRETIPDDILSIADDVILIDTTPETLRERLRAGKIYGPEKIDDALSNFFRTENLAALRELALREIVRARGGTRRPAPFARIALGVKARERDIDLIERCARIALRLEIDFSVVHVARTAEAGAGRVVTALQEAARRVRARWILATGDDPARELITAAAQDNAGTVAVEGALAKKRWPGGGGTPFARRLLESGARQLLILAPPRSS
jgi:two-component system sensor histidine kinase KdpD